ncbi:MAG TPA: hypothetical protein VFT22_15275 [Kofleriaceae bacterium]|nr:hypothetical protein [Kofleriaceae bacterium]
MSPAYDGKGQPPASNGWFSGLTSWLAGLTPRYVHRTSGSTGAALRPGLGGSATAGAAGSPTSTPPMTADPSGASAVTSATGTAKP